MKYFIKHYLLFALTEHIISSCKTHSETIVSELDDIETQSESLSTINHKNIKENNFTTKTLSQLYQELEKIQTEILNIMNKLQVNADLTQSINSNKLVKDKKAYKKRLKNKRQRNQKQLKKWKSKLDEVTKLINNIERSEKRRDNL